jgi:hypothetical protein
VGSIVCEIRGCTVLWEYRMLPRVTYVIIFDVALPNFIGYRPDKRHSKVSEAIRDSRGNRGNDEAGFA